MEVRLVLQTGKQAGRETVLARGVYLVGRSRVCQIRPKNKAVSRKHCAIIHKRREVLLQDVGSKTGTYLNSKRMEAGVAVSIKDGDSLRVGRTKFSFRVITGPIEAGDSGIETAEPQQPKATTRTSTGIHEPTPRVSPTNVETEPVEHEAVLASKPFQTHSLNIKRAEAKDEADHQGRADNASPMDEVLELLEQDDEENAGNSHIIQEPNFSTAAEIELDEEDNSDGDVDFAAPRSEESLSSELPVPSYQLRQDWDVGSVHKWVASKQVDAPTPKTPKRSFKLKDPKKRREPQTDEELKEEKIRAIQEELAPKNPTVLEKLSNTELKPYFAIGGIVLAVIFIAYNIYLLYSFDG